MRETSNLFSKQNSQQPKQFRGDDKKVMKKSLLAFVLAFSLVLSVAVPAFAATPADVVGKKEQSAVEELTALGIINGYADGTFKPENEITRAELAKIIVIGSGNEGAAKLMQNVKPTFKDVKANVWYTGYINAAATKGYILGDKGTKNFRPGDAVKFEEVVAIMVRALGYQENKLSGAWPYNYLLKAQDLGLFNGVDVNVGNKAVRGVVAQLTSNTLNAKLVTYNADGNEVLSSNALISKLGNTSSAELLGAAVVDGKVTLRWTEKNSSNVDVVKYEGVAVASNFIVTGGKTLVDLLGHNVTVVKGKDGKVVAISDAQDAGATLVGKLEGTPAAGSVVVKVGTEVKTKSTVAGSVYFVNSEVQATNTAAAGDDVTVYLSNDQVRVVVAEHWAVKDALVTSFEEKNAYRDARLNYNAGSSFITDATSVTLDGKAAKASDLKKDDVISVVEKSGDKAVKVVAVRSTATGKLEAVGSTNGTAKYTLGGKVYEASSNAVAADINTLIVANIGKEFTLLLNADGKIVKASAPAAAVNKPYAVVLEVTTANVLENEQIVAKTKVTYFDVKANANAVKYTDASLSATFTALVNQVAELEFNADGKLIAGVAKEDIDGAGTAVAKITATQIDLAATSYLIGSNVVVIDATKLGQAAVADRKLAVSTIAQITKNDLVIVESGNGINADYIILKSDVDAASTAMDAVYGLFVSADATSTSATSTTYTATLNVGGQNVTKNIGAAAYDALVDTDGAGTTDTTKANKNDVVTLTDTVLTNTVYDVAAIGGTSLTSISVASNQAANTFGSNAGNFIVSGKTTVYVVSADGNTIYVGNYTDVKENAGTIPNSTVASITVVDAGTDLGIYSEAAVIVVKRK